MSTWRASDNRMKCSKALKKAVGEKYHFGSLKGIVRELLATEPRDSDLWGFCRQWLFNKRIKPSPNRTVWWLDSRP